MIESVAGFVPPVVLLIGALSILLFSAERMVGASEEVGVALGVPPFVIGLTVLAVGTSLPELVTGIFALVGGSGEIVVGTVVGSNVANILLILGFAAVYAREIVIDWDLLHGDLPVLFGSVLLMVFLIYPVSGQDLEIFRTLGQLGSSQPGPETARSFITLLEGVVLLAGYVLYIYYYTRADVKGAGNPGSAAVQGPRIGWKPIFWIAVGLIGVPIGAHFTVEAAIQMADRLLVGKEVIAASMISVGTSLPELVVSYSAVKRKNFEMALGNVTGSNIFNTFVVLGVPAIIAPYVGNKTPLPAGEQSILYLQLPFYIATMITFLVIVLDKKLTRTEGLLFLLAYVVFIAKLYSFI